jgi:putative tryptophan/tyrosine transport system substrate-binding protein
MRRREFIAGLGSATAWPLVAGAQQQTVPVIGLLHIVKADVDSSLVPSFRAGLAEIGFVEGRNLAIEYRWADNRSERLPALAKDLVARRVAAIGALGGAGTALAAKNATTTIPIVFAAPNNPVELGLVSSLNRPGGNVTGVSGFADELVGKRLAILHELVPRSAVFGALFNPAGTDASDNLSPKAVSEAAATLGLQLHFVEVNDEAELEATFAKLAQLKVGALLASTSGPLSTWRYRIAALAARYRIATMYSRPDFVEAGGLACYGADFNDLYRKAGVYLGRILHGEKPADLPVLQPAKFEFVINLKAAKALEFDVPPNLLALADRVIE